MRKEVAPIGGKRGCLGKDGKYSPKNCTGELQNQGVGSLVGQSTIIIINTNNSRVITSN